MMMYLGINLKELLIDIGDSDAPFFNKLIHSLILCSSIYDILCVVQGGCII